MDSPHGIQHIDFEYGVVVLAMPDPHSDRNTDCDVRGGYGSMCSWKPCELLGVYRSMRSWLDRAIAEMEESL